MNYTKIKYIDFDKNTHKKFLFGLLFCMISSILLSLVFMGMVVDINIPIEIVGVSLTSLVVSIFYFTSINVRRL